jgi:hypothetical protein
MKIIKHSMPIAVCSLLLVGLTASAAEAPGQAAKSEPEVNPYPLKTCLVSGEKLGGDMGDPYVFKYKGQEIKLCCKGCLKDFEKEPSKFVKKLEPQAKDAKGAKPSKPDNSKSGHQH